MNIFETHHAIVREYKNYIESFINIRKDHIREAVQDALDNGKLWPNPLIQFNPIYKEGEPVASLIKNGVLHSGLGHVFKGYNLYHHQVEALTLGAQGKGFIVTSGTGSGKSLTFLGTIFNYLQKEPGIPGVKAILIYPMNALINSQYQEIEKYAANYQKNTGADFPITFAQYTGQEDEETRDKIRANPPDILLTNYMMLELILTRSADVDVRNSVYKSLRYLVYDELHTFRGRQGSDVALLNRRLRALCKNEITCIGTSATMVSGGSLFDQKAKVAEVASTFFGVEFEPEQVIVERLEPSLSAEPVTKGALVRAIQGGINIHGSWEDLYNDPLAHWLEQNAALYITGEGHTMRKKPQTLEQITKELSDFTGLGEATCQAALIQELEWISRVNVKAAEEGKKTILPYKLHQFISQTGSVYATLEQDETRQKITLESGIYDVEDGVRMIYPLVFSRETGQEFYCVTLDLGQNMIYPREFSEVPLDKDEEEPDQLSMVGYIIPAPDAWDESRLVDVPGNWVNQRKDGSFTIKKKYRSRMPRYIWFKADGAFSFEAPTESGLWFEGWYMPYRLLFDPTSMTFYSSMTKDRTKLTALGSEGRATATTILTFNILRQFAEANYPSDKQKVLSFTDNRQDAALQAGHFNDFISTVRIRSAIYKALRDAPKGKLEFNEIGEAVADALNLAPEDYAENPAAFGRMKRENREALIDFLMYRILYDLRRSWRVILPNLEQCGLLEIRYKDIEEVSQDPEFYQQVGWLAKMPARDRAALIYQSLEFFRREYAISSRTYLTYEQVRQKKLNIEQKLKAPWAFDEEELVTLPNYLRYERLDDRNRDYTVSLGHISAYGIFFRNTLARLDVEDNLKNIKRDDHPALMEQWLELLSQAGWLKREERQSADGKDTYVYQLDIAALEWALADKQEVEIDPIKMRALTAYKKPANRYFREIYRSDISNRSSLEALDHTGQIKNEDRQIREERFREGKLAALYCSPTMELGIDIASLDVVHMRNVPPNPASYAQRSGRSGRSGQAALVFTFCSSYSPHDKHYFNDIIGMVSGEVVAPRLDLINRELLQSHLQSMALGELGIDKPMSHSSDRGIGGLVDIRQEGYPLFQEVQEALKFRLGQAQRHRLAQTFRKVAEDIEPELIGGKGKSWYRAEWIDQVLEQFPQNFNRAFNRWRKLYEVAILQLEEATDQIRTGLYKRGSSEFRRLQAQQGLAQRQLDLLLNVDKDKYGLSEFYPYRYLASEGFLPGYNFTRLPIRSFLQTKDSGEYLSRPRFIALREFGPLNVIYHSGSKYRIERLVLPGSLQFSKAKISPKSGYFMEGEDYNRDTCPITGLSLAEGNAADNTYINLVEMTETQGMAAERISCDEEERISQGFSIKTYFTVPGGMERIQRAEVKNDGKHLLTLQYIPAARLVQVNEKWRRNREEKFPVGAETGFFRKHTFEPDPDKEAVERIQLYTWDTADALYIQPIQALGLDIEGRISLMYALKRAIEVEFQVEPSEIGVEQMGDPENPNLLIYENAEGSLGILSQIVNSAETFNQLIERAIRICRFDDPDYKAPASYHDLLSYYNQRYHHQVNRFSIKDKLNMLRKCQVHLSQTNTKEYNYEEHYRQLLAAYDKESSTERVFLDFLYKNRLRLPDWAQVRHAELYVQPDFVYESNGIRTWIFCDGTPHDDPEIRERDRLQRRAIRKTGDEYWVYYYRDNLADKVNERPDLFKKMQ
ncbi:MAG: DEAD/DEAH box helicase [Lewinellaceae bacterium]|nr:DEAD/DEAH box helicase [Lewinellaceae bacterium]